MAAAVKGKVSVAYMIKGKQSLLAIFCKIQGKERSVTTVHGLPY